MPTSVAPEIRPAVSKSSGEPKSKAASEFFQSSMIENNRIKSSLKTMDFLIALTVNAVILAGPILAGLITPAMDPPGLFPLLRRPRTRGAAALL
jgi:hypothetical protein